MKILHTSDWHLGQTFYNYSREEEHRAFCAQLCDIAASEKPDAIVVAGDIFDVSLPPIGAQDLLVQMLMHLHSAAPGSVIVVIAGNHDSASRLRIHSPLWRMCGVRIVALPEMADGVRDLDSQILSIPPYDEPERTAGYVVACPFVSEGNYQRYVADAPRESAVREYHSRLMERVEQLNADALPVVMTAHLALSDSAGHTSAILNFRDTADMASGWDYLALGHIHRPSSFCDGRARYCGSPFPLSFDEQYPHSVSLVTIAAHGAMPEVREVAIRVPVPVMSVPQAPKPLEEVLETLRRLPDGHGAYLRVNLEIEDFIPGNARKAIDDAIVDKNYRFCGINGVRARRRGGDAGAPQQLTTDQIREMDPLEVADQYYQKKYQIALPERFSKCLKEIISDMEDAES